MSTKTMLIFKSDSDGRRGPRHSGTTGISSAIWMAVVQTDKSRITIHNASWDYEGSEDRHGTRVTSLAEVPYFDEKAPTRREALGLEDS
jgi:hypothetical protein